MSNTQDLSQVLAKRAAVLAGNEALVEARHAAGRLTARERIAKLMDVGSFVEMGMLHSDGDGGIGVITGYGTVQSRPVYVFAQDYLIKEGAMGQAHAQKICKLLDMAKKTGAPVIALCDSGGVLLNEGAGAMAAYGKIYAHMARLSGVCPMIGIILGPCIGGAALLAQLCDISIIAKDVGELMAFGPQVISAPNGKNYTAKEVGGADVMGDQGGIALVAQDEASALALANSLLGLLPGSNMEDAPIIDTDDMNRLMDSVDPMDAAGLLGAMADGGFYIELFMNYGKALRIALSRIGGRTAGMIISNANELDGCLDAASCKKAARFIRFCDCFSIPLVNLLNSKGVIIPEIDAQASLMAALSQLVYAYSEATVPKVSIIIGNAIGQSYMALAGGENADVSYAWPGAVISALLPEAAVQLLYGDKLASGSDSPIVDRENLANEYASEVADGINAAKQGMVDDVIDPAQTRKYVIAALEMLASKRDTNPPKKHGNLPI